jgi:hypothetical protein
MHKRSDSIDRRGFREQIPYTLNIDRYGFIIPKTGISAPCSKNPHGENPLGQSVEQRKLDAEHSADPRARWPNGTPSLTSTTRLKIDSLDFPHQKKRMARKPESENNFPRISANEIHRAGDGLYGIQECWIIIISRLTPRSRATPDHPL